jgi:hypothetical protein
MARLIATLALALGLIATAAQAGTVILYRPAPLAKDMPALPRITGALTPADARINTALAKVDASWRDFIKDCHDQAGADADVERSNQVAMRGPGYFAVTIGYSYSCGGTHPDGGSVALVYDLNTGRPVNWTQLLPRALVDSASTDTAGDGTTIGLIASKTLQKIYAREALAHADADTRKDCGEVLTQDGLTFQVWPDAKAGGLMIQPDLPHVVMACGDPQLISIPALERLGVGAPLLTAIEAANANAH